MLRDHWYPLLRTNDLPSDRPVGAQLFGEFIVFFRDAAGVAHCLLDRCSHRSVPLSLGQICEGMIECAYHGWRFGAGGACERIPTHTPGETIPKNASVPAWPTIERGGLVWVWPGIADAADPKAIPSYPEFTSPDWWVPAQGVMELDIDYSLMIENLVDPSHLPFTHRTTLATPDEAQPLTVELQSLGGGHLHAVIRSTKSPPLQIPDFFAFDPPCHIRIGKNDKSLNRLFHCIPTAPGRMRLIWWMALRRSDLDEKMRQELSVPELAEKIEQNMLECQNMIFAEDVAMLLAQQSRIAQGARAFACPVKSDLMALRCREWRDSNDAPGTWFEGFDAAKNGRGKLPLIEKRAGVDSRLTGGLERPAEDAPSPSHTAPLPRAGQQT